MNRYTALQVSPDGIERIAAIQQTAEGLARLIDLTPGRHASLALTHLETAVMMATRAVAVAMPATPVGDPEC